MIGALQENSRLTYFCSLYALYTGVSSVQICLGLCVLRCVFPNLRIHQPLLCRIMLIAVDVSRHHISSYKDIPLSWKAAIISLLETAWAYWQCIDKYDRAKEKEKEDLYVYKTRETIVKEEECSIDVLFPSYSDTFMPDSKFQNEEAKAHVPCDSDDVKKQKEISLMHFTSAEMMKICGLYMHVFCHKAILPSISAINVPFSALYELTASLMRKGNPVPGGWIFYCCSDILCLTSKR